MTGKIDMCLKTLIQTTLLSAAALTLAGCGAVQPTQTPTPVTTPTAAASTSPAAQGGQTVSYTDSGFSPKSITVKAGAAVTFMNNSNAQIELDSDPHPQHTSFSAFNAHMLPPGKSFSFTFTTPMTLRYHNHLNASNTGTVIVQ